MATSYVVVWKGLVIFQDSRDIDDTVLLGAMAEQGAASVGYRGWFGFAGGQAAHSS